MVLFIDFFFLVNLKDFYSLIQFYIKIVQNSHPSILICLFQSVYIHVNLSLFLFIYLSFHIYVNVHNHLSLLVSILIYWLIGLVGRVFTNGPGDLGSIPGRIIPKTLSMVLDTSLLNTQQYKVHIKGKVKQFRERSTRCSSYWKGSLLVVFD